MATDWVKRTREAFDASTEYVDQNCRADWDYSLRAFRNEHAAGSKYLSEEYKARSRLFRPKTRTVIRKNEAAGAVALFSNMEIVDLQPGNPDDPMSVAARDAMKAILEYRLTRTIPTFQIAMGGIQDAQTQGLVISYQYWKYETRGGKKVKDEPCIELRPLENIRIDGGADWIDPVESSPYLFDIIPMYVCEVRAMMNNKDTKTGQPKWKKYDDSKIAQALPEEIDIARRSRTGKSGYEDKKSKKALSDFDTVWVMRCFMRDSVGVDYTYFTLGTEHLLTDPKPIDEVYFHGKRPYVIGCAILETHRVFKSSMPMMTKPLQMEANDVQNQRLDNVKFVLNKRWLVARGRQVDVQSLVRNVPGGVTLTTDPKTDVIESNWPDVTSSAYVEQDRISADFDDLAGNFTPSTKVANKAMNDTLGGSRMAAMGAGIMTDYLLRTVIETWWEPVLRQLMLLEQYYETDEVVLKVAAQKAQLLKNYGLYTIGEDLLAKDVLLNVNVGMGASNPQQRMQNFMAAVQADVWLTQNAPTGTNLVEMRKEIYSNAGYRDGARFMQTQQDPRLVKALQMISSLQQAVQGKRMELTADQQKEQMKLLSGEKVKAAELQIDRERILGDLRIREAEIEVEKQKIQLEWLKAQVELRGATEEQHAKMLELISKVEQSQMKLEEARLKVAVAQEQAQADMEKAASEREVARTELLTAQTALENERQSKETTDRVKVDMEKVSNELKQLKAELGGRVEELSRGQANIATVVSAPKRKASGIKLKKDGKKTRAVVVEFDDGTAEEVAVQ